MAIEVPRKIYSADEYNGMIESGVLTEEDRAELAESWGVYRC
jgi:hypothetical protein